MGLSIGIFGKDSLLRKKLYILVTSDNFNRLIVLCILLSSVQLAMDVSYTDPASVKKSTLHWIDVSTIVVFTVEAVIKVVTFGVIVNGEKSYLRDGWNLLDITILVFSYICLTPLDQQFKFIKTLRILRSLRLIGRNEGLRVALRALYFAIPKILNITAAMVLFFIIFAVICISSFKGKMYYCLGQIQTETMTPLSKWDCLDAGGSWLNKTFNWDNLSNALV